VDANSIKVFRKGDILMALVKTQDPRGFEMFGPDPKFPDMPYPEYKARLEKAKRLMREQNVDLLMLWGENNCRYFTGVTSIHWVPPSIQTLVALIPVDGDPVVIAGEFFKWTAEGTSWVRDIRCQPDVHLETSERELPREVAETVKGMGYGKARIGLEKGHLGHMWIPRPLNDIETLMKNLPEATFVDGDEVIWGCRMIKSPLEIERLTKAAAFHRKALATVVEEFRPGMTEFDVGKIFLLSAYEQGVEKVLNGHIACGRDKEGIFDTMYQFDGIPVNTGDYLWMDMIVNYKGYWADNGRVINVGAPTEEFIKINDLMWKAFDTAVATAKPGIPAKALWDAVNKVEAEMDLGTCEMVGHGIGLDIHEPPVLGKNNEHVLMPGMTLECEPHALKAFRRQGGVGPFHIENLLIITENGCVPLIGLCRDIIQTAYPK
jgi:Xaa-Pro dipeptidase